MKHLIIDAGSTKTEWVLVADGLSIERFVLGGFNPNYSDSNVLREMVWQNLTTIPDDLDEIHYYGTGCGLETNKELVSAVLKSRFPGAAIEVDTDMMGAAKALFGTQNGIACILGTGVNSCLYNGERVVDQAVSLGFIIGDEGSGCHIGKKLTRAYFYGLMPPKVKLQFEEYYHLKINDFIHNVYHGKESSRYLAGFTRFAGEHQDEPFIHQLLKDCFYDFISVFIQRYDGCKQQPIGLVGSVAYHFQSILNECFEEKCLTISKVMKSPMDGLISCFSNR